MRGQWLAVFVLLLASSSIRAQDQAKEEDGKVIEEPELHDEEEEKKIEFVPIKFKVPVLPPEHAPAEYLWEYFRGKNAIGTTWLKSTAKKEGVDSDISKYDGEWEIGQPSEVAIEGDYSLIVKTIARHHAIATNLVRPMKLADSDKPFVLQYEVRYEEGQNCGGGYVKVLSEGAEKDLGNFNDKTPYTIMFGPDKCSPTGKVHLIFRYRNPVNGTVSEHHAPQASSVPSTLWEDKKSHLYTLVLHPDGRYTVAVDYKSLASGSILTDLLPPLEPPQEIADPEDKKPEDWDERPEIEDETAVKPDDWDENAPKEIVDEAAAKPSDWLEEEEPLIADPTAKIPEDWDTEMDGEWEPPMMENPACKSISGCGEWKRPVIPNPAYKGKWRRPRITNPAYKGIWSARLISNPAYFNPREGHPLAGLAPVSALGIELWTMSKAIMFDNILVADSEAAATEAAKLTFDVRRAEEARMRAAKGENSGFFSGLLEAAEETPWLWAVYVLCILVPLILIAVFCFGQKSQPDKNAAYKKKHDEVVEDDDEAPLLVNGESGEDRHSEEGEEAVQEEIVADLEQEKKKSRSPARKSPARATPTSAAAKKKSARQAIEEADNSTDSEEDASDDEEEEKEEEKVETVPVKRRGRPKRAD